MRATSRPIPGLYGWIALAAFIVAWDLHPRTETLSNAFAPPDSHGRRGAILLWIYTTLHLIRILPPKADAFHLIGDLTAKKGSN